MMRPRRKYDRDDSYFTDEDYLISRKMLGDDDTFDEDYLDMADAVSSSDCTGLVTNGPGFEDELSRYSQLYKFGTSPDE